MAVLRLLLVGGVVAIAAAASAASPADTLLQSALVAEARHDTKRALDLFLALEELRPGDSFVLQKIARQYSDQTGDVPTEAEQRAMAERALEYARRATELDPDNAVNVLSLAICHGKLGLYSDVRSRISYSRLVKEYAERALVLDPGYAWASHVLGRWHHEVSTLSGVARLFVRWFSEGLPAASTADAVRLLTRAVELEPDELAHHLELGFALLAHKQIPEARTAFTRGLAMPSRAKHDESAKARARAAMAAWPN